MAGEGSLSHGPPAVPTEHIKLRAFHGPGTSLLVDAMPIRSYLKLRILPVCSIVEQLLEEEVGWIGRCLRSNFGIATVSARSAVCEQLN